jgi:hypothetical protein
LTQCRRSGANDSVPKLLVAQQRTKPTFWTGRASEVAHSRRQLVEQDLGLFQVERIETFGEPAIDWGKKITGLQ